VGSADREAWEWPDALDALAAAPEHHRLLLENDDVRVLETRISPGATVPVHTHRWPSVLTLLSPGHAVRRDDEGRILTAARVTDALPEPGVTIWMAAMPPHSVENIGDAEIHLLTVELKRC